MAKDKHGLDVPVKFKKADKDIIDLKFNTEGQPFFCIEASFIERGYTQEEAAELALYYQQFDSKEKKEKKPKKTKKAKKVK